jgi:hypothetical protein
MDFDIEVETTQITLKTNIGQNQFTKYYYAYNTLYSYMGIDISK